ncbi:hypothetical protein HK097_007138 [Rhizophlyctis rosea]|uniref:Uncharacterized protein n=1 Tax=Rhizophlyctis rosea TaxID=64517 RepID=A0AAD5SF06_9FUNG|nr:hypothetical protein HK097_007138 [Rhizophlyctis rosea]
MTESTELSKCFARQGLPIHIRKDYGSMKDAGSSVPSSAVSSATASPSRSRNTTPGLATPKGAQAKLPSRLGGQQAGPVGGKDADEEVDAEGISREAGPTLIIDEGTGILGPDVGNDDEGIEQIGGMGGDEGDQGEDEGEGEEGGVQEAGLLAELLGSGSGT